MKRMIFIALSLLCFISVAEIRYSNVGAKSIEYIEGAKDIPSASAYVQEGLVAMWDGIENAGWGEHDYELGVCVDLIGGKTLTGTVEEESFVVEQQKTINNVDTSGDMTIEWVWRDSGADRNSQLFTFTAQNAYRYQVTDVRVGYQNYQVRYWNGTAQTTVYPMLKKVRGGTVSYGEGLFSVFREGVLVGSYDNAVAADSTRFLCSKGSAFNSIRIYSRTLSAEEVAYNHMIDKARFGL